jgi:hypothetical protein
MKLDDYVGFILEEEINMYMSFFEIDFNIFRYVEKEVCYQK